MSVSFPLTIQRQREERAWESITQRRDGGETRSAGFDFEGARVFVGASKIITNDGPEWFGKLEFNPSRVGDPDGYGLCPAEDVLPRLELVATEAERLLWSDVEPCDYRVKRLDVSRDFDEVDDIGSVLVGLSRVHRPFSRKNHLMNDGARNGAETLVVGAHKAGNTIAYDKHQETYGRAPEGTLRYETHARAGWLSRYSEITHAADISSASATSLARNRFDWAGFGVEVATLDVLLARVDGLALSNRQLMPFLGWVMATSRGRTVPMSSRTLAKYRSFMRQAGVTLGPESGTTGVYGRLDWDVGKVVLRAA